MKSKKVKKTKKFSKKCLQSGAIPCAICGIHTSLIEHHINGRSIPNPNQKANLCYICSNCHLQIHLGNIIIEGKFFTTEGEQLIFRNKSDESITGCVKNPPLYIR